MEKEQILKSLGFSDEFLKSLNDYEKIANVIEVKDDVQLNHIQFPNFDNGSDFIISKTNDSPNIYFLK